MVFCGLAMYSVSLLAGDGYLVINNADVSESAMDEFASLSVFRNPMLNIDICIHSNYFKRYFRVFISYSLVCRSPLDAVMLGYLYNFLYRYLFNS